MILPNITRVILQSNNARSYQNSIVPFFMHMLSISTGIFVSHYIHTEKGSDKGIVNGNFEKMMKIVRNYVDVGFNVCTLTQMFCTIN